MRSSVGTGVLSQANQPHTFDLQRPRNRNQPLRQVLMNVLRASPASALVFADALQSFIFCCCGVNVFASLAAGADRQVFMKVLRSSPLSVLVVAAALQEVILFCWAVAAKPWEHSIRPIINNGIRSIFMEFSPCYRAGGHGLPTSVAKPCNIFTGHGCLPGGTAPGYSRRGAGTWR